ncbi:MAG: NADH-quinone oxidoreductase subunit C [Candidatus Margulisiibacteriota bacterium]
MSETEKLKQIVEEKFDYLKDAVKMQRERRLWAEVPYNKFFEVFDFLVKEHKFSFISTITGLDEGEYLAFIYHLSGQNGTLFNLKTKILKDKETIRTITNYFPSAAIYERELEDLLGVKVDNLPKGIHYPLPDDWPQGEYPLRKNWDASVLDKGENKE